MTRSQKPPIAYFGGKQHLVDVLLAILPPHEVFVETHGGSAALLFAKPPARLEVYNDLDVGLVNFYRVLRDASRAAELRRLLDLTPYSRDEWHECRATWQDASSDVEMARRWFVALCQSFSKTPSSSGWSYCKQPSGHSVTKFRSLVNLIPDAVTRLAHVQVEHMDALAALARYDAPNVLFYVDPPYVQNVRRGGGYHHEMSDLDHEVLLRALRRLSGMVLLSGYASPLYERELADWPHVDAATFNYSANRVRERRITAFGGRRMP